MNRPIDFSTVWGAAVGSTNGRHRWRLLRSWSPLFHENPLVYVGLNPSTADALTDDATVRRMVRFAYDLGHDGIVVVNLYTLRATDPDELAAADPADRNDPEGAHAVTELAKPGQRVVACWGSRPYGWRWAAPRAHEVAALYRNAGCELLAFDRWHAGVPIVGPPPHPLYLDQNTKLQPWMGHQTELTATEAP